MKKGFTLAEVLITLAIIGVVSALTIPSVITNYKKTMYVTQLKKEYNSITNAFRTAMARDGVTRLSDTKLWTAMSVNYFEPTNLQNNSEAYSEFSKIFNVVTIYGREQNKLPFDNNRIVYRPLDGERQAGPGELIMYDAVCLADGACITFSFYKTPKIKKCGEHDCSSLSEFQAYYNTPTKFWRRLGEISIDVNGIHKGPNQLGRDYFFWFQVSDDGNLYPYGGIDYAMYQGDSYEEIMADGGYYWKNSAKTYYCNPDTTWSGYGCAARVMENGWKMDY